MDERRLRYCIIDVLIHGLHFYDERDKQSEPKTATETVAACINKYHHDPVFRVHVDSITAQLMDIVRQDNRELREELETALDSQCRCDSTQFK